MALADESPHALRVQRTWVRCSRAARKSSLAMPGGRSGPGQRRLGLRLTISPGHAPVIPPPSSKGLSFRQLSA